MDHNSNCGLAFLFCKAKALQCYIVTNKVAHIKVVLKMLNFLEITIIFARLKGKVVVLQILLPMEANGAKTEQAVLLKRLVLDKF